jgi:LPXTG-motif cell wall-anchored protein
MRKATLIGTIVAAIMVFGLMLVPIAGASTAKAPALQTTATVAATEAATAEATTGTAATAVATTSTVATTAATSGTTAATATTAPGSLPRTGGDSGMGTILLGAAALFILGIAVATLLASRRGVRS